LSIFSVSLKEKELRNQSLHIWMNMPSYYQNDLFNELSKRYENFEVVYAQEGDLAREKQGWNFDLIQNYDSKIINKNLNISQLIKYVYRNRNSTHIVNGIWAEQYFFLVIVLLNFFGSDFFIYSEASVPQKKRSIFKQFMLDFLIKPISKILIYRAKGFLAVSVFAENHFQSLGVKSAKIYRFGYFRNISFFSKSSTIDIPPAPLQRGISTNPISALKSNEGKPLGYKRQDVAQLIFVGQLIERKGIFTLFEAIKNLVKTTPNFHLNIIGTGILETQIRQYIEGNNLENFVTIQGVINSENVSQYIQKADLLILPSVFDGWGIVINEALQNHVPALVSDQCGAKELIKNEENGLIFKAQNVESLSEQLLKFLQLSKEQKAKMKTKVVETSQKIAIPKVVNYLMKCLNHAENSTLQKPIAPWLI
jgi:glycosyltransferase involved in cell wall biosynthesis